jgi:hypothetical protein
MARPMATPRPEVTADDGTRSLVMGIGPLESGVATGRAGHRVLFCCQLTKGHLL